MYFFFTLESTAENCQHRVEKVALKIIGLNVFKTQQKLYFLAQKSKNNSGKQTQNETFMNI